MHTLNRGFSYCYKSCMIIWSSHHPTVCRQLYWRHFLDFCCFVPAVVNLHTTVYKAVSVCGLVQAVELAVWDSTAQKKMTTGEQGTATVLKHRTYACSIAWSFRHAGHRLQLRSFILLYCTLAYNHFTQLHFSATTFLVLHTCTCTYSTAQCTYQDTLSRNA